jgi:hypothetical protein
MLLLALLALLALLVVTRCSLRCCAERCSVVLLCDGKIVAAQTQCGCESSMKFKRCYSGAAAVINHTRRQRGCSALSRLQQVFAVRNKNESSDTNYNNVGV